jgi:hypothetical protein
VSTRPKRVVKPPTEAEVILKAFEDARKKANITTKSVTVDADFNIIQIQEPHGLPPSLIVPRIAAKKIIKPERQSPASARTTRGINKKPETTRRKPQGRLVELDVPKFDTEVADMSFTDKVICSPGVTFRDGNSVRSRPPQTNANQLTRAQYEEYLEEMKRTVDM